MLQTIGMALVALGIIGLIWGFMQKLKAGRVAGAPLAKTGEVAARGAAAAGPKGAVSVEGNVVCQQPLLAPMSGTPCLYYTIKCTARWKDGDENKTKEIDKQKAAAQFAIDDGSGPVWIDAREGGDFEPTASKSQTRGTGLMGGIVGGDVVFGNYRVQTGMLSMGTEYQVQEEVLAVEPKLYVCGKVADQGGAITAPGWRSLIISNKTRDELLGSAAKGAKIFLIAGAAAFGVGTTMALLGQFVFSDEPSSTASTAAATAAAAATQAPASTPAKPAGKPTKK